MHETPPAEAYVCILVRLLLLQYGTIIRYFMVYLNVNCHELQSKFMHENMYDWSEPNLYDENYSFLNLWTHTYISSFFCLSFQVSMAQITIYKLSPDNYCFLYIYEYLIVLMSNLEII